MKNKQIPYSATKRESKKNIRTPNANISTKPVWRFSTVDKTGPFKWPVGKAEELEIIKQLHNFDSMEWEEIKGASHHFINVSDLSNIAINQLKSISQDDIEQIFSFRISAKQRIFCLPLDRGIARLLWYDPNHEVCPSKKKHT